MEKYDLRDYHNEEFVRDNCKNFLLASLFAFTGGSVLFIPTILTLAMNNHLTLKHMRNTYANRRAVFKERNDISETLADNIADVLREHNITELEDVFQIFCDCLNNGSFSYKHKYCPKFINEGDNKLGWKNAIFLGRGVCRHQAQLLCDVLRRLGFDAREFFGKVNIYSPNIDHVIAYVKHDHKTYFLDPTIGKCFVCSGEGILITMDCNNIMFMINSGQANVNFIFDYYRKYLGLSILDIMSFLYFDGYKDNAILPKSNCGDIEGVISEEIYNKNKKLYKKLNKSYCDYHF